VPTPGHKSCGSSWAPSEFLRVPSGQARTLADRGELDLARRFDEILLRLSRQCDDFARLGLSHSCNRAIQMFAGKFEGA
jgi:hypothetical protein